MISKLACLILTLSFLSSTCLHAKKGNATPVDRSQVTKTDSAWIIDNALNSALIIPSYEELLETYYEAVVTVDQRLNFNPYRFQPGNTEKVNPFVYKDIVLPEGTVDKIEINNLGVEESDFFEKSAIEILLDSRTHIAQTNPELITVTWDQLPDPPQTGKKVDIIQKVNLDLRVIDKKSRNINGPKKLEKKVYTYIPWQVKIVATLSANQTAFSNWSKGGSNSFALSGRVVTDADYMSFDKKTQWQNNLESRLGYVQEQDKPFVKNLDYFRLNSQYARNAVNKWFYAVNAEFTSQFFEGYNYKKDNYVDPISAFMAPAYLKVAMGLDYKYATKKNKKLFSMQASPISYKLTYVKDTVKIDQEKYGIESNKRNRQEIGGSVQFRTDYALNEKISGYSRLLFFSNYMENPQNVDINWNSAITYNISRIFAVNFTLDMVYDDDVNILLNEADDGTKTYGQRLQIKEYLGFALTYRFM